MAGLMLPATLRSGLQNRSLVLFAGAGLSRLSGAPLWNELLVGLVDHAADEGIELQATYDQARSFCNGTTEQKYALAAHLRNRMKNHFGNYVRTRLEPLEPSDAHRKLVELNWSGYITTNYDTLIEDAYYDLHGKRLRTITWKDTDELSRLDEIDRWIVKIHGCVTRTHTIVLDETSLAELLKAGAASEALRDRFRRYGVLFMGYSLGDPDVMSELRRLTGVFGQSTRRHYAILPDDNSADFWRQYLDDQYSIQVLSYSASNGHLEGILPWLSKFEEQGATEGRPSRKKILCIVKALRFASSVLPREAILVTDDIPRWGLSRPESRPGATSKLEKAYLLPPLDDLGQDRVAVAAAFADHARLPRESVEVEEIGDEFGQTKFNPMLKVDTDYTFRTAIVRITGHEDWFEANQVHFRDVECTWKSIQDLRQHNPTARLNGDVLDAILAAYGEDLQRAPYAMSKPLLSARDPYAERASRYAQLPWVKDETVLATILNAALKDATGVLDLGCGAGFVGEYILRQQSLPYVGVDRSFSMLREAKGVLGGRDGVNFLSEDFVTRETSRDKFDGYVFLLKNVLHLISDVYDLWPRLIRDWGVPQRIVVVETVSPDPECRFWIDHLFKRMDATHKRHLFTADDLNAPLTSAGLRIVQSQRIEQFIDVHQWLDSFDLASDVRASALRTIENAPTSVARTMKIAPNADGRLHMLRLQQMLIAESEN